MQYNFALAQINPTLGNIKENLNKHMLFIDEALKNKADLIVFPELSLSGYYLKDRSMEIALEKDDKFLSPLKKASKQIDIVFGFVERGADKNIYNSALYLSGGTIVHIHRKIYLPTHGIFEELRFMNRGSEVKAFDTRFGKVTLLICRDFFHPSLLFLAYAQNSDFVIVPSNMPLRGLKGEKPEIQSTVEKAADTYTNFFGNFVVYVNRVGFDDGLGFYGGSFIESPSGEKTGYAGILEERITFGNVDTEDIYRKRQSFPLLREEDLNIVYKNLRRIMEER
jgi:predicted amidohydrolase